MTNVEHAPKEASFQDVIRIDEEQVRGHVDQVVRATEEETLNSLLSAEFFFRRISGSCAPAASPCR